jgi:hypothetical protein
MQFFACLCDFLSFPSGSCMEAFSDSSFNREQNRPPFCFLIIINATLMANAISSSLICIVNIVPILLAPLLLLINYNYYHRHY